VRIGFFLNGAAASGYTLARHFVAGARAVMPGVDVCQLTDLESPALEGVTVLRRPAQPSFTATLADAYAQPGEWLFADTDVVLQRSVADIVADDWWQVAVASRSGTYVDLAEETSVFMAAMPFNTGAVFSRCPAFWEECRQRILALPALHQPWYGMQLVVGAMALEGRYRVRILPNEYNYPPRTQTDDVSAKALVHYKGPRKGWLLERYGVPA